MANRNYDDGTGETIWFVVGVEPFDIRMADDIDQSIMDAARTLNARFFIRRTNHFVGSLTAEWSVYDTALKGRCMANPIKRMVHADIGPVLMYALAKGFG